MNLTKNALKFSPKKNVYIKANYHTHKQMLLVHIEDKGKGIKQDEMDKIFKTFGKIERTEEIN